jgi:hypothetical protein
MPYSATLFLGIKENYGKLKSMDKWMMFLGMSYLKSIQTSLEIALSDFDLHEKKFNINGLSLECVVNTKEKIDNSIKVFSLLYYKEEN